MSNVNKILGAIGLTDTSGSLTNIPSNVISDGDVAFVVSTSNFYIFKCIELSSPNAITTPPYSVENPPLVLMPSDDLTTTKRWHLVSINSLTTDLKQSIGKYIKTSKIKCYDDFVIEDTNGNEVLSIDNSGNVLISCLTVPNNKLISNLNAEYIGNVHYENIMQTNGTKSFTECVAGIDPEYDEHFATKRYVDNIYTNLDPDKYMKKDGTTAFLAPVRGVNPTDDYDLTTKIYVDQVEEKILSGINDTTNNITYKNGQLDIPINSNNIIVTFGGNLEQYSVFITLVNTEDDIPSRYIPLIVNQQSTYFVVDFGDSIDSENFKLSWTVIAY